MVTLIALIFSNQGLVLGELLLVLSRTVAQVKLVFEAGAGGGTGQSQVTLAQSPPFSVLQSQKGLVFSSQASCSLQFISFF